MQYTPREIAELLKDKPQQPHYIEALINKALETERRKVSRWLVKEHECHDLALEVMRGSHADA